MTESRFRLDWVTILLLVLMLAMAAYTLAQSEWAPGLERLQPTSMAGLLLGVLLARSKFRGLVSHLLALGYGAAWIAFESINYLPRAIGARTLGEQMVALGRHIAEWFWLLFQTGLGKDNFVFLLSMMVVFWLLGYLAGWNTFRFQRALRVMLPAGLVILIDLFYYGGRAQLPVFLYLYFVFALMYLVRVHYLIREREWQQSRIGYDSELRGSFVRGGSLVTLTAILIAWFVPEVAPMPQFDDLWRQLSRPLRSVEDTFNRVFSSLQGEGPALTNPYGRTLGFAGPRSLGDTVLMDVYVHSTPDNASALARYWRAGSYDYYTSNGWRSSDTQTYVFKPTADPLPTGYLQRSNVRQTFTIYFPRTSLLLAAAQPVSFDREAEADALLVPASAGGTTSGGGGAAQPYVDPSLIVSRDVLRAGSAYEVVSALPIAGTDMLRNAGADYPDWVRARDLQLPNDFSQRVRDLARQIVEDAGATNAYDQASALERWLRVNIAYDDKIPGPALGQDGVDYVLFQSRAGYCDYYASAMVTMARALGIPARMAVGYARGQFDPSTQTFRVRERDAHAWVEVFFPQYGWIEFEPTSAQPQISRPVPVDQNSEPDPAGAVPTPASRLDPRRARQLSEEEGIDQAGAGSILPQLLTQTLPAGLFILASTLAGVALVAVGAIYIVENRGLRHLTGTRWAYARLVRVAAWLRVDLRPHQTPYEQAALLQGAAPESQRAIDAIADDFVRETFARDSSGAERARSTWRSTHFSLWWSGLRRRIRGTFAVRRLPRLRTPRLRKR